MYRYSQLQLQKASSEKKSAKAILSLLWRRGVVCAKHNPSTNKACNLRSLWHWMVRAEGIAILRGRRKWWPVGSEMALFALPPDANCRKVKLLIPDPWRVALWGVTVCLRSQAKSPAVNLWPTCDTLWWVTPNRTLEKPRIYLSCMFLFMCVCVWCFF